MTLAGWRETVISAIARDAAGDPTLLDLTAAVLHEQDEAKQALRDKGYGCTGTGLLKTVGEVPAAGADERVATKKPNECTHEDFHARVAVGRILDVGKFVADVTIKCADCGEPFRFVGVPAGISYDHPMISIDGLELHAPIEPEIEKRLMDRATFHMTKAPTRQ